MWVGATNFNLGMYFFVPSGFTYASTYKFERELDGVPVNRVPGVCWYTNLDHGRRHEPMSLMSEADNKKFSKHKEVKGVGYKKYDNYAAIEVPFADAIPSDYKGAMGVPISFLSRYNPEQFEILGTTESNDPQNPLRTRTYTSQECRDAYFAHFGKEGTYDLNASGVVAGKKTYKRILIKHRSPDS